MIIGILETGLAPVELRADWGSYDGMIRVMLGADRRYRTYDVQAGVLPADPGECAAYVITGSASGVYDDLPWIPPLLAFIRAAHGRARMVGICFGHQAMATALGGRVEKSARGWGIGLHRYAIVAPPPHMREPVGLAIPASHQDQVVVVPPGARVLAASAFTPVAGLDYGDGAISVQAHPEFKPAFAAALIGLRRAVYGDALADAALLSLLQPDDCGRAAEWLQAFVDGATPERAAAE